MATRVFVVLAISSLFLISVSSPNFSSTSSEEPEEEIVVVVTAPREEPEAGPSRPVSIIQAEELEETGAENLAEAIETVASVDVLPYGGPGAMALAHIRGASSDQVLVRLDGVPINTGQGGGVDLSKLPLESIERIEVSRGAVSSRFGAGAMGGVIDIFTKSGQTAPYTKARLDVASFGTFKGVLSTGGQASPLDYFLSLENSSTDGDFSYTAPDGSRQRRENSQYHNHNEFLNLGWHPTQDSRLSLQFQNNRSRQGVPGHIQFPSPNALQRNARTVASLNYKSFPSLGLQLEGCLYHHLTRLRYEDPDAFPAPIDSDHRNRATGIELKLSEETEEAQGQPFGLNWVRETLNSSKIGRKARTTFALYNHWRLKKGSWLFIPEVRLDRQSQYGSFFSPALGIVWEKSPKETYRFNLGRAFRAPSFDDLYWPEDEFAVGNPDLRPEKSVNLDIGWEREIGSSGKIRATLFHTSATDLIVWQPSEGGKWSPTNIGKALMQGLEAEAELKKGPFSYEFDYTFLRAIDNTGDPITGGKQLIGRPRHQAHLRLNYLRPPWRGRLEFEYTSKRFTNTANTKALGGYFLTDVNLARNIDDSKELSLVVRNLWDKSYQIQSGYPLPGREVRLGYSVNF